MNGAQISAFQANSGIAPSAMATVLVGVVFAVLLVWGVWAIEPPTWGGRRAASTSASSSASASALSRCTSS